MNLRRTVLLTTVAAALSLVGANAAGAVAPSPDATPPVTNDTHACLVIRNVYKRSIAHGGEDGARAAANAVNIWGLSGCAATYGPITNWV
jgi:hypothetical protein